MRLDDPEAVRAEYSGESRFAERASVWAGATGPDPRELAFRAVAEVEPRRVLEVGPGRGELAARIRDELGAEVHAVDQSERMVELTRSRGVDAVVGDIQALPFDDASFDCAVAAWMLYHVQDLDRGLAEVARVLRPGGRLVAVTNAGLNLPELWGLLGTDAGRIPGFNAENGEASLRRHFARVERRESRGALTFPDRAAAQRYVDASPAMGLGGELPELEEPLVCSRLSVVFVAETA